jgi:hypothetical protein
MRSSRTWVYLISVLVFSASPLWAQTAGLAGTVNVQHRPLASAAVSAYLLDKQGSKTVSQWATVTAANGSFAFSSLPYGTYVVVVRFQGRILYQGKIRLNTPEGQQLPINLS